NIVRDPAANVSLVSMSFQPGTILYNPPSLNPYYNNATSTYYLDVTSSSQPDFVARFNYPFAPDIVIQKTSTPNIGPVGTTHIIVVTVQNLANVTTTNTDPTQITSHSGPLTQFSRTFIDFQPYSFLLLIPLLITPVIETYRLIRRRNQRRKEKEMQSFYATPPPPPQQNLPKAPDTGTGSNPNNPPPP